MNEEKESKQHQSHAHAEPDSVILPREEYDALMAKLKELEEMHDKYLRSAADFDNAKKRLMRERDEFAKFSQENLIRQMLPVLDNLERALAHAREDKENNPQFKSLIAGLEMIFKQMLETFKSQGVVRLQTVGQKFDPHRHEAVAYQQEKGKEDEILDEIEPGYLLHDKLLRAAKVRIRIPASAHEKKAAVTDEKQDEIT